MNTSPLHKLASKLWICPEGLHINLRQSIFTSIHLSQLRLNRDSPLFRFLHDGLDLSNAFYMIEQRAIHHYGVKGTT